MLVEEEKGQYTELLVTETVVVKVEGDGDLSLGMCSVSAWDPSWHSQQETAGSLAGVWIESSWDGGVQASHPHEW